MITSVVCAHTLLLCTAVTTAEMPNMSEDSIQVTVVGTLRSGIVAIGGESTGTTITAKGITWELEFGKNAAFRTAAAKLDGKRVTVQGSLERRRGIEIRERWIVTVTDLRESDAADVGDREEPALQATVGRTDTRVRFAVDHNKTVIDISSGFGIDKATIKRRAEEWPKSILVRLHLRGLESFKASGDWSRGGNVTIEWSVASTGKNDSRVSLQSREREITLGKESPYFTQVGIVGPHRKIPLQDGYFEIPLPAKLFDRNPPAITLSWIDFYRN